MKDFRKSQHAIMTKTEEIRYRIISGKYIVNIILSGENKKYVPKWISLGWALYWSYLIQHLTFYSHT